MNKILFLFVSFSYLYSENNVMDIESTFSTEYFSKGSIYNHSHNDFSTINNLTLEFLTICFAKLL